MREPVLNRRLTLEEPVRVADGAGGYVTTWNALGTLWADLRPRTGRERADVALSVSQVPWRITVRAAPPGAASRPRPEQRFVEGSRVFHILAVAEADASGRYLICFAKEEVLA